VSLEGMQIGALAAGIGSLITGLGVPVINGLFGRRGIEHTATMGTITMLSEKLKEADAREREAKERCDELEENIGVHHGVIRDARLELSNLLWRDDLNECREELVKVRKKLDTRIR
jgi:hypothetical protein